MNANQKRLVKNLDNALDRLLVTYYETKNRAQASFNDDQALTAEQLPVYLVNCRNSALFFRIAQNNPQRLDSATGSIISIAVFLERFFKTYWTETRGARTRASQLVKAVDALLYDWND